MNLALKILLPRLGDGVMPAVFCGVTTLLLLGLDSADQLADSCCLLLYRGLSLKLVSTGRMGPWSAILVLQRHMLLQIVSLM